MSIQKDSFNIGHWVGILPSAQIKQYVFQEESLSDYIAENRISDNLGLSEDTITIFAYDTPEGVRHEIGIVVDDRHCICPTGTGFYLCQKEN